MNATTKIKHPLTAHMGLNPPAALAGQPLLKRRILTGGELTHGRKRLYFKMQ
jgi:hypothetical protein